ncbi:MAG: hypothetical protein IT423_11135 [Pirellulaceae bacterium]|nr:hypothetical protein [Pirellulaceae bacterium]
MRQRMYRGLLWLMALACLFVIPSSTADAGWGRHWGHWGHHHWHGGYVGWGFPSYTSVYFSAPRYRLYAPAYRVSYYSAYRVGYYPTYSVGYYDYCPPRISYSVSLPSYYVAPPVHVAPVVYPTVYDPCFYSAATYPSSYLSPDVSSPIYSDPTYVQPGYSTGTAPALSGATQVASSSGSFVDRMLTRSAPTSLIGSNSIVRSTSAMARGDGSARATGLPVSTLKPVVAASFATSNSQGLLDSRGDLEPIPAVLLETADQMFAVGGFAQAASAYARLTVRYGNHDELAVRRFIALVASGDHSQAAVVYQLAQANALPLRVSALPQGSLEKLYGPLVAMREQHINSLANYAFQSNEDAVSLGMVGTWLVLDGQSERAQVFLQRAEKMSDAITSPATATPVATTSLEPTHLADVGVAR